MDLRCAKLVEPGSLSVTDQALAIVLQSRNANLSLGALPSSHHLGSVHAAKIPPASEWNPAKTGAWFAQVLHSRWKSYCERLDACRDEPSEEAVHELRVAIRRLLSQFVLLTRVISDGPPQKARRILKHQLQSLGALRDTTVQRVFIERLLPRFPELSDLCRQLGRRERRLIKTASRELNHFKTNKLEKWIRGIIAHFNQNLRGAPRGERLTLLALRLTEQAFAETVALRRLVEFSDSRTIHRVRVAFKKFRYGVECLPSGLTGLSKRELRKLAYYQRRMGNIQDVEVIRESITEFILQNENVEGLLVPFCAHLRRRRSSAVRAFRGSVDELYSFWPPPGLSAPAL